MNEQDDLRDLLGTALRGEPPSALDPARLVALGKRRLRLQRAGAALGVMVVAGGIALGASLLHPGGARPDQISTAGTSTTTGPSATTGPNEITTSPGPSSATTTPTMYLPNRQAILAQQSQALDSAYSMPAGMSVSTGKLAFTANPNPDNGFSGSHLTAILRDGYGSGEFILSTTVTGLPVNAVSCAGSKMTCTVQLINGITVEVESDHPTAYTTRILTVAGNGNVLVTGQVDNLASSTSKTATRPTPPLSADQLARITAAVALASP
ncbi:MAG TPA: hypothetical protein VGM75_16750 [Pseudonocardiaceae bacterium]